MAGHADPARAVENALTLLATGRAGMARTVLEPLPGLIREARAAAEAGDARFAAALREPRIRIRGREREMEERERPPRRAAGPRPPRPKPRERLAAALVSGRADAGRVAAFLRIAPGDVQAIAEGRVGLPGSTWRRLLAALDIPSPLPSPSEEDPGRAG